MTTAAIAIPLAELSTNENSCLRLGEILAALSHALDITEGQPAGHAARSCLIGMHLADQLQLPPDDRSALYYAILLKDAGCSSNAAKMAYLFGADDRKLKHDVKTIDWQKAGDSLRYMRQQVAPDNTTLSRLLKIGALLLQGPRGAKKLVQTRCERGAEIARQLGFPETTAVAIKQLDEHYNGKGHPFGLRGEEISLLGRIAGLAQTVEVFYRRFGGQATQQMLLARSGTWFDPQLVAFLQCAPNSFWQSLHDPDPARRVAALEPIDAAQRIDDRLLDRVAEAFAQVVDAKSPWTYRHSTGVADISLGMADYLGFSEDRRRWLRRTALLHDIGKLGISNMILDKPGKLTDEEFSAIKLHPNLSEQILSRVTAFSAQAAIAGAHHERLDGRGYYRGISSAECPLEARILMVADIFEALTAARPYREGLAPEKVIAMLTKDAGVVVCPVSLDALKGWLERRDFESRMASQLAQLDRLQNELADPTCQAC